jgi:hypothetical protein
MQFRLLDGVTPIVMTFLIPALRARSSTAGNLFWKYGASRCACESISIDLSLYEKKITVSPKAQVSYSGFENNQIKILVQVSLVVEKIKAKLCR